MENTATATAGAGRGSFGADVRKYEGEIDDIREPFSLSSANAGKKEGLERSKSKDKRMGMEDGRYGTFCVENCEYLLRISVGLI